MLSYSAGLWRICCAAAAEGRTGFFSERRACPRLHSGFKGEAMVKYGKDKCKLLSCFVNHFLVSRPTQYLGMQHWATRPAAQATTLPKVQGASKQLLSLKDTRLKNTGKPNQSAFTSSVMQSSKPVFHVCAWWLLHVLQSKKVLKAKQADIGA